MPIIIVLTSESLWIFIYIYSSPLPPIKLLLKTKTFIQKLNFSLIDVGEFFLSYYIQLLYKIQFERLIEIILRFYLLIVSEEKTYFKLQFPFIIIPRKLFNISHFVAFSHNIIIIIFLTYYHWCNLYTLWEPLIVIQYFFTWGNL